MKQVTQSEPYRYLKAMLAKCKIDNSRIERKIVVNVKDISFVQRNNSCIKYEEKTVVQIVLLGKHVIREFPYQCLPRASYSEVSSPNY